MDDEDISNDDCIIRMIVHGYNYVCVSVAEFRYVKFT